MKTVYFLRHGETTGNRGLKHQFPETPLSEYGLVQASKAGEHFANIPIEVILASPFMRAQQTAHAVAERTNVPIETTDLFAELRRPHALWGMHWLHPRSLLTMARIYLNADKPAWRYSDEENLEEFHARARRALECLADRPERVILVVTHRGFMANLVERMRRDGMDTVAQYRRALWKNVLIPNCAYVTARWVPEGEGGETLDGTWTVKRGVTKPEGVQSRFGLG
jgi:broad specificity phosphatase PhoE